MDVLCLDLSYDLHIGLVLLTKMFYGEIVTIGEAIKVGTVTPKLPARDSSRTANILKMRQ